MKNKIILFTLLLTCFETTHAGDEISDMLGQENGAALPLVEDVIALENEIDHAANQRTNDEDGIGEVIKQVEGQVEGQVENAVEQASAELPLLVNEMIKDENEAKLDDAIGEVIKQVEGQVENAVEQASAEPVNEVKKDTEIKELINEIQGALPDRYIVNKWQELVPLLQSASEQEKRDAIEQMGKTSLVREKYNNSIDEFLTAVEIELAARSSFFSWMDEVEQASAEPVNEVKKDKEIKELINKIQRGQGERLVLNNWKELITLLQSASEQEKRDAIENLGATSLVSEKYNNNIDEFLTAFEQELATPPSSFFMMRQEIMSRGMNFVPSSSHTLGEIQKFLQNYMDDGLVQKPIMRELFPLRKLKYLGGGKSLNDLALYLKAASLSGEISEKYSNYLKDFVAKYVSLLSPQDLQDFKDQEESMMNDPESSEFMDFNNPNSAFPVYLKPISRLKA